MALAVLYAPIITLWGNNDAVDASHAIDATSRSGSEDKSAAALFEDVEDPAATTSAESERQRGLCGDRETK